MRYRQATHEAWFSSFSSAEGLSRELQKVNAQHVLHPDRLSASLMVLPKRSKPQRAKLSCFITRPRSCAQRRSDAVDLLRGFLVHQDAPTSQHEAV